jgi:hypothetical protein
MRRRRMPAGRFTLLYERHLSASGGFLSRPIGCGSPVPGAHPVRATLVRLGRIPAAIHPPPSADGLAVPGTAGFSLPPWPFCWAEGLAVASRFTHPSGTPPRASSVIPTDLSDEALAKSEAEESISPTSAFA